jgi:hypothetical protein
VICVPTPLGSLWGLGVETGDYDGVDATALGERQASKGFVHAVSTSNDALSLHPSVFCNSGKCITASERKAFVVLSNIEASEETRHRTPGSWSDASPRAALGKRQD